MDLELDSTRLMFGDCLERLDEIDDETINLTVTSPPYDNLRTYNDERVQWSEKIWRDILRELYRVTVKGGVVVWIVTDASIGGDKTGSSFNQAIFAKECGVNLYDVLI